MSGKKYTPEQRIAKFWSRVDKSGGDDACWIWIAGKDRAGYGTFKWDGKHQKAHRTSYRLANGEIPNGLHVLHDCPTGDNPACVNPKHLWLGTNKDNINDRIRKGRTAKGEKSGKNTHPEKFPVGERHPSAKLTEMQVLEIRYLYLHKQASQRQLAKRFGVSQVNIGNIVRRKRWKTTPAQ